MTQWTWTGIDGQVIPSRRRAGALMTRLVVTVLVALFLWWIGFGIAAIAVLVAASLLGVLALTWPGAYDRVTRVLERFGHAIGHVIGVALLTVVNLLVFAPVAVLFRVFGHDPLRTGTRRGEASLWQERHARSMPARPFADDRSVFRPAGAVPRRPVVLRVATALGVVVLILAADLAAGWVYDEVSGATRGSPAGASDSLEIPDQPAMSDSPWAADFIAEGKYVTSNRDTYLGYRFNDFHGRYLNIVDGVRQSYEPAGGSPLKVWFFGASALFGFIQRDEHTIPSEVARLAEQDGLTIEVRNYGRPATGVWMELALLQELVSRGDKPDLVVFYDGFNDLAWQLNLRLSPDPYNPFDPSLDPKGQTETGSPTNTHVGAAPAPVRSTDDGSTSVSDIVDAYWKQAGSHRLYDAISDLIDPPGRAPVRFATGVEEHHTKASPASSESIQAARNAISIQERAATLVSALGEARHFDSAFFYQPNVFSRRVLQQEEVRYRSLPSYEPARWDPAVAQARRLLKPPYVDLSQALDGATSPVMVDFVHTNEEGARLAAEAVYQNLKPRLVALEKKAKR